MKYRKEIPEIEPCDLLVCGGGPAGVAAALSAARQGLKVRLVESQAQLGGMATSGHVSQWLGGRSQEGAWVVAGLFRELAEAAVADGCALLPGPPPRDRAYQPHGWMPWFAHGVPVEPFGLARLLDRKMIEAGVELLFETQAVDALVRDDRISHVVISNKSGLQAVPAAVFVDATGDADIAALSGCGFELGREPDHLTTLSSLIFHVYNVRAGDLAQYIERNRAPKFIREIEKLRSQGQWPFDINCCLSTKLVHDDVFMLNTVHILEACGIDARSRSDALVRGRQGCRELLGVLRRNFPGFRDARIKSVASTLGVRESRRITGDFRLRADDLEQGRDFPDTIGFSMFGWDLLDPKNPNRMPHADISTGRYICKTPKTSTVPIPYRIMVPRPVQNLLCPGRAVSVERDVLGPLRVMAPCAAMGEAAGIAAGLVFREGVPARGISVQELRRRLREAGCLVDRECLPPVSARRDPE